eukprot:scaffold1803_cov92-Amphora_coffeaeformis.AAC.48
MARDTNVRGGYDQRKLPGKFEPSMPAVVAKGCILKNVVEPISIAKWESAVGPIGPASTSFDRIQLHENEQYEDKFMLSFHELVARLPSPQAAQERFFW